MVLPTSRRLARLVAAAAVLVVAGWPAGASAQVGTPKYPDLRALPPDELRFEVNEAQHNLLYFSPRILNLGTGAFEVQRVPQAPPLAGLAELRQRIYEDPAGFRDEKIGTVPMAATFNFDIPNLMRYELWTERAYERARSRNFTRGVPLYVTPDVSWCVADVERFAEDAAEAGVYAECTAVVQGISPGWADVEGPFDPHLIDVGTSPLPDGKYVLRAIVDPDNILWESDGKADPGRESQVSNQGLTRFEILNGAITWNG